MSWYKYIFLKFYHLLNPSLRFESAEPRPTLSKWLLLLWYEGYQALHNGIGSHCPVQPSPSAKFKPRNFESHCANIPIWKREYMKSQNLIVVFSSGVYLAGNSNTLKIVYLPPILKTKMFLSVLTKKLNWESLTKHLITFNFIMGFHWKIWFY